MNNERPYYLQRAKNILGQADGLLSLSHRCASGVEYVGFATDSVTITYYGVDTEFFGSATDVDVEKHRERWGLAGKRIVLYTGRLSEITGVSILVETVPRVITQCPDAHFVLTGKESAYRRRLQRHVQELGIDRHVTFTGFLPKSDLPALYAMCNLLVYPQSVPYGCWGLSLLEAMSAAKPVVASRIAGVPEVVIDGETGILVEPGDSQLLAEAILSLLQDKHLARRMGATGFERVTTRFDQKVTSRYIERVFRKIIEDEISGAKA